MMPTSWSWAVCGNSRGIWKWKDILVFAVRSNQGATIMVVIESLVECQNRGREIQIRTKRWEMSSFVTQRIANKNCSSIRKGVAHVTQNWGLKLTGAFLRPYLVPTAKSVLSPCVPDHTIPRTLPFPCCSRYCW